MLAAAFTAAAADSQSTSLDDLIPYALSTCLDCHSDRAVPGAADAMIFLARVGGRQRGDGRGGEGGAVLCREPPVVGVGLRPGDAVAEGAEHRESAVEQPEVEGVIGARRRTPDHEDRLVGGARDVHEIAREWFSEKLTTAPVMGTMTMSTFGSATIASRILRPRASATGGPPQSTGLLTRRYVRDEPVVERGLRRLRQFGQAESRRGGHVGEVGASAAGDRVDADARIAAALGPGR